MKIDMLTLFFREALKSIKRNAVVSIASIATVMVTLFVLGLFLILLLNIRLGVTNYVNPKLEVQVLLDHNIKIAAYSKREEIKVMKSIGATDWFITWPFIFDGMIIGFLGSAGAILSIYILYNFTYKKLTSYSVSSFLSFINPSFVLTTMSWIFILIGTFISAIISCFSIQKFLEVQ